MAELVYALVSGASRATGVGSTPIQCTIYALVAQLDRVQPSEGWGQAFESPRARHLDKSDLDSSRSFFLLAGEHFSALRKDVENEFGV